jgi:hypothetical protein
MTFNNLYKALSNISSAPLPDDRLGDDYDDNSSTSSSPATINISTGAIVGIIIAVLACIAIALRFSGFFAASSTANPMGNQVVMVQQSGSRVDV